MSIAEHERYVEQYLGGSMTPSQEEEFFINVAIDGDLRRVLRAHRIVDSAIRKHRDAVGSPNNAARARMMAALSGMPSPEARLRTQQQARRSAEASRRRWTPGLAMLSIVVTVALGAMAVGIFVVAPAIGVGTPGATSPATHGASRTIAQNGLPATPAPSDRSAAPTASPAISARVDAPAGASPVITAPIQPEVTTGRAQRRPEAATEGLQPARRATETHDRMTNGPAGRETTRLETAATDRTPRSAEDRRRTLPSRAVTSDRASSNSEIDTPKNDAPVRQRTVAVGDTSIRIRARIQFPQTQP